MERRDAMQEFGVCRIAEFAGAPCPGCVELCGQCVPPPRPLTHQEMDDAVQRVFGAGPAEMFGTGPWRPRL